MPPTSNIIDRPRSLVSHVMNLAGADPVTARMFIDGSGKAALKRLGVKPAVKARTKTTSRDKRHIVIKLGAGSTDESAPQLVRRRNFRTGRHTFVQVTDKAVARRARRRRSVPVHRYSFQQVAAVLADMKPRKAEYKELRDAALATVAAKTDRSGLKARRLPRQKKWSKRRNRR